MAVSPAVIKAIATAATDKRTRKALAILLAAIFMPLILLIVLIAGMVSGVESANNNLLDYSFAGAEIPAEFTDEQRGAIEDMREWLGELNDTISEKENNEECSLDGNMVRAAFYCLNFGGELGEDFCSLSDEKCEEYLRVFAEPHTITQDEVEQDMCIKILGL